MAAHGLPAQLLGRESHPDLDFLNFDQPDAGTHIFLENPQQALHLTDEERQAAALLDLNYYLPCRLQQKTIAVIGLGRTTHGDFLSSEDVELLESLASYIGIAIQNARLYASLEQKISEYERLKEFNENIVESINVGIFAVDLEERVESWNAQMEVMYAMSRQEAVGTIPARHSAGRLCDGIPALEGRAGRAQSLPLPAADPQRREPLRQHRHRAAGLAQL